MGDRSPAASGPPATPPAQRPGLRVVAAAAVGVIALIGGCASGGDGATASLAATTSSSIGATTAVVAPTSAGPTDTAAAAATTAPAPPPSTAAPVDPTATLQQSIVALGGAYHFATTATVGGTVVATAEGERIGDGSRLAVSANGTTVHYVITADGTWVQQEGQDWQQLDDPPATTDPVTALAAPNAVELTSDDGTTVTLRVSVPSTALGVPGDGDVPVTTAVNGGVLTTVTYESTVGGVPANIVATLGPATDTSPVTAPA